MNSSRSKFNKMFGKIEKGSMRGSALLLFQTAIGAGALALPFQVRKVGLVGETIILGVTAYLLYFVLYTLGRISIKKKSKSYPELIMKVTECITLV